MNESIEFTPGNASAPHNSPGDFTEIRGRIKSFIKGIFGNNGHENNYIRSAEVESMVDGKTSEYIPRENSSGRRKTIETTRNIFCSYIISI